MIGRLLSNLRAWLTGSTTLRRPAPWLTDSLVGSRGAAGVAVGGYRSLCYAYVNQGVQILAGDVSCLPLHVYERRADGSRDRAVIPASRVIRHPNELQTQRQFLECLMVNALIWGNGYARVFRDGAGAVTEIIPLLPELTKVNMIAGRKVVSYRLDHLEDRPTGQWYEAMGRDVLHIRGLSADGVAGFISWVLNRDAWSRGLASEQYASRRMANNALPRGLIEQEAAFGEEDLDALRAMIEQMYGGVERAGRLGILPYGARFKEFDSSPADIQLVEQEKYLRQQVASHFNLPPHMLGDESRTSYASVEAERRAYLAQTLQRWLVEIEQEFGAKLLTPRQIAADSHYFEFVREALLQTDTQTKWEIYEVARRSEVLSVNEIRQRENLPPVDGGDAHVNPNRRPDSQPPTLGVAEEPETEDEQAAA